MLKKRIVPCLDIHDGRTVKGVNFLGLRDAGDPVELAMNYANDGADELVFLDISATVEGRRTLVDLVRQIASVINIPFTVGGGINRIEAIDDLLLAGADKVALNSAAVAQPELIGAAASRFGSQCVVVAIDAKFDGDDWWVYVKGGRQRTHLRVCDWAREAVNRGAGELLLTSMDADGTKNGFDLALTQAVCDAVPVPVIASGGAGSIDDFRALFETTAASAGLAASIFHYGEVPIPILKKALKSTKIPIR